MIKIDRHTVIQVLGSLMHHPEYLSEVDKYTVEVGDFPNALDRYIYTAINNLYNNGDGVKEIKSVDVIKYLERNDVANHTMEKENGVDFIQDCENNSDSSNFQYYYNRLKKLNFLRDIQKSGRSIEQFYCEDITNPNYTEINDRFEVMTVNDILNSLKAEIHGYESKFIINGQVKEGKACDGVRDLVKSLQMKPEVGLKLQGDILSTVCRGGRKGKLYLRSAASGVGKTRRMVGDACNIAYPLRFDVKRNKWVPTGSCEPVLYVMTEQDTAEIQTMILAYLTGYNEEIFLYGTYTEKEMPRIQKAIQIMETYDHFYTAEVPDPCSDIIKNLFRTHNMFHNVEHIFYDYIFSSPAMLNEYRDLKVREDVALRLFTTTIKNLAKELNAFIMSATQLTLSNEDAAKGGFKDERFIRGSKAINDLSDFSSIMSRPTQEELTQLAGFQQQFSFVPTLVTDVFKNRGGRWNRIRIWSNYDAGCLRTEDMFITTADMKPIEDFRIVDFKTIDFSNVVELIKEFNETDNGKDVILSGDHNSTILPEQLLDAADAFDDEEDKRRRVHNISFSELV